MDAGRRTDWNKQQHWFLNRLQKRDRTMKNLKVISIHKVQYLSETNVRKFRGQKCMMLQHTWEKLKKHLPYMDTYYSFSYNDTTVMDNVYPSLHAILQSHFLLSWSEECQMHNYKQNWWHQDADNIDRSQAWQLENWIHLLPCYAVLVA